ncbi:glycoside hydrolase family 3 C-terminal domain-containing protein [Phycicoccus endophyticus]|uniref:Exo-alpha-(1->6)-L-arabinopyranosidase n=1 Tax=Phycicoccus endophyticus TaxID=1690220 RepID=A0A7G9QZS8_9MICO|nr:glycoside hydrolase family 3 N-terminal domain-containing protein [Phycicoccus endophyticus]NHI20049.1 glycosyl hydrolase [Phycicoccus endophyticus]QNN48853.1 glycoside hydrolase family 3 C-terminal domain-containing protein [Phycicoccus endophyticus]GGL42286.1 glycosyl hydrolase [Phycicoccus endophyticus]
MTSAQPAGPTATSAVTDSPLWRDPTRTVEERVEALLAAMTLREKVAQLGSRWAGNDMRHDETPDAPPADGPQAEPAEEGETFIVAPMQDVFAASGSVPLEEASRDGLGQLTRVYGSRPLTVAEGAAEVARQQRVVLAGNRLGIPALVHEECLTGFTTYGATVYPAAIAWAATFDPDLVEQMAAAIGRDMAAAGVHQGLSPVLDVVRDPRWGRVEETMGEDPHLVATVGSAYVRGLQSAGVVATLKHFAGYSASRGARNHGPVSMGRRELLEVILPPFETAVREGGARSVMNSYSDVDGVPAGADPWLLTDVLREAWGFEGTVVSDYWAVPFLASMHRVAPDVEGAGVAALRAGIDVELPDTSGFGGHLVGLVETGALDEALVDRAARRHLRHKVELGLLDPDWTPEGSVAGAEGLDLDAPGNRAIATALAERSVVLLDPGTALPLTGESRTTPSRVAVVGPCADDPRTHMGCYAFPNHVLPRYPGRGPGLEVSTMLDSLRAELPDSEVGYALGCAVEGEDTSGIAAAAALAAQADLTVAFVGDRAGLFGIGTSGEGCDAEDLRLPGAQPRLVEALLETGTPLVLVVVSGRPYALGQWAERVAGLVQAFMPGEEGGPAVAGVLSGRVQPSGHLPVQVPWGPGGQPRTYLQPPLGSAESSGISSLETRAAFPFGHGRSYTTFAVEDLRLSAAQVPSDGEVEVTCRVTNTGGRAGEEVLQLYVRDVVASVVRPVRQLLGFTRVPLEAGESSEVTFGLHTDRLAVVGRDLSRVVEPGLFEVFVGSSAEDLPCRAALEVTGTPRVVGHERRLTTPAACTPGRSAP